MASGKPNLWDRRRARRHLVQAVYQWQMGGQDYTTIRDEFRAASSFKKVDAEFFDALLSKVINDVAGLDEAFGPLLDRRAEQLDHVERAILRLASAELLHRIDVPYRVVIDEYVELAKLFGAQDSFKYINGVLDKLATQVRVAEVGQRE